MQNKDPMTELADRAMAEQLGMAIIRNTRLSAQVQVLQAQKASLEKRVTELLKRAEDLGSEVDNNNDSCDED